MATELFTFGVKYRLLVEDTQKTSWKIEIEEKDYVGSVTDFLGDGSAFEITWEQNEDYNKVIVGSFARINIMAKPVNDVGSPDFTELFTTDENKYRVKIYYNLQTLPLANWTLYWQGFIVQDDYVEQVDADPYRIQVVATENFGKMKFFPYNDNDPSLHLTYKTPAEILYESLTKIGLAIDVNDLSGLKLNELPASLSTPFCETVYVLSDALAKGDSFNDNYSYFEAIEAYLKSTNCFMVQSYGELYIISKASYDSVFNNNFDWSGFKLTFGASSFSSASILSADVPINELDIPVDFKISDRSVVKTRRSAAQAVINEYNLEPRNLFYNGSFERDSVSDGSNQKIAGWFGRFQSLPLDPLAFTFVTTTNNSGTGNRALTGSLQTPSTASFFEGANAADRNSIYTEAQISTDYEDDPLSNTINPFAKGVPFTQAHSSGDNYELQGDLSFKVYIPDGVSPSAVLFRYSIMWARPSLATIYYDFENGEWSTDHKFGSETINEFGLWQTFSKSIPFEVTDNVGTTDGIVTFRVHIVSPETDNPTGSQTYILDDVSFKVYQPEGNDSALSKGNNVFVSSVEEADDALGSEVQEEGVLFGITKFYDSSISGSDDLLERSDLVTDRTKQQYYSVDASEVVDVKWFYDKAPSPSSPYTPRTQTLQQWVNEHRRNETENTQTYLQGNLKNVTNVNGGGIYKPITPLDIISISLRSGSYDTNKYLISRLSVNPRLNLINFVAKNIVETQGSYVNP